MNDAERDLLLAVLENPASDTARLVYADWLDEHGDPERAEFIRCQIEHSRIPIHECDCIYPGCTVFGKYVGHDHKCRGYKPQQRYIELWDEYGVKWFGKNSFKMDVFRGWPSEIHCTLAEFMGRDGPPRHDCQQCRGRGYWERPVPNLNTYTLRSLPVTADDVAYKIEHVPCNICGRIEGLAKRIGETWPVTRIILTDKSSRDGDFNWWRRANGFSLRNGIPAEIMKLIDGKEPYGRRNYDSETEAIDSLSNALVRYMRFFANLPPLPGTVHHSTARAS